MKLDMEYPKLDKVQRINLKDSLLKLNYKNKYVISLLGKSSKF